ncbi:MAG: DUF1631 domain-containing protein [Gammaproteobacteria bacterium]
MAVDNVIAFGQSAGVARRRVSGGRVKGLIAQCRGVVAETLPHLLQDLFENLDDDLYALADKSSNDSLHSRYFAAMRELRKLRGKIEPAYLNRALETYDKFWRHAGGDQEFASPLESAELSLVDEAELEQDLAVTAIVSKAQNRFHRELYALNQRFALLAGVDEVDDTVNPVGPAELTAHFRHALSLWGGDVSVELVIFKLFERHVMDYVGGLYDDLNDLLIKADILPKITHRTPKNPVAPSVQRARDPAAAETQEPAGATAPGGGPGGAGWGGGTPARSEVLNVLRGLLATQRSEEGGQPAADLPVVPATEVIGVLSDLQESFRSAAPTTSFEEAQAAQQAVRVRLATTLGIGSGGEAKRRFGQDEQDVIDVISMLFEFILDDRNLPDAMKALLSRLQIPMLKVAIVDRNFFAAKNHPARRLLNDLARAAVGWVDDGNRSGNTLYARVEAIVNRVLNEFVDDPAVFAEISRDFDEYLEREARGAQVAEERITQVNRGQEQLKLARDRVQRELNDRLVAAGAVPEAVRELLLEGWKDVLLLALLREGEDSDAWRSALDVAEQLIWSVTPKPDQAQRQRLLKVIPDLLSSVRDGLTNISFDQHKAAQLFKALQVCHIAALRGTPVEGVEIPKSSPLDEAAAEVIAAGEPGEGEPAPDEFDALVRSLAVGQWIEWVDEDERSLRGKLAWKSEVTGTYVLVSRKGTKIAELTAAGIAERFRVGKADVLENVNTPLMDRALNAMVDALRRNSGAGTTPAPA